jgi:hypothetical protein
VALPPLHSVPDIPAILLSINDEQNRKKIGRTKNANFLYILKEKLTNKNFSSYYGENLSKSAQGQATHTGKFQASVSCGRKLFKYLQVLTNVSDVHCKNCALNFGLPLKKLFGSKFS